MTQILIAGLVTSIIETGMAHVEPRSKYDELRAAIGFCGMVFCAAALIAGIFV